MPNTEPLYLRYLSTTSLAVSKTEIREYLLTEGRNITPALRVVLNNVADDIDEVLESRQLRLDVD